MGRKIIAALISLPFLFFLPPLLISQAVITTLLNHKAFVEHVVPKLYDPMAEVIVANVASNQPTDAALFKARIQKMLPRAEYIQLTSNAIEKIFIDSSERLELTSTKQLIKESIPGMVERMETCMPGEDGRSAFRFCMPLEAADYSEPRKRIVERLLLMVENEVPSATEFSTMQARQIFMALQNTPDVNKVLTLFLLFIMSIYFLLMRLILSSWNIVSRYVGVLLVMVSGMMTLFMLGIKNLIEMSPWNSEPGAEALRSIVQILVEVPRHYLTQLTIGTFSMGLAALLIGIFYHHNHEGHSHTHSSHES